ncbi:hypothetical protein JD844_001263 [Phrynosoma platyrhinos]|uniref:C2H2-type domain-containing protein n=1 Tax=Phrynosoma platyrhinos TaxID=52577 RepID=A0ABQ7T9C9_PHRPL|nr:hypothetical protein JD844_001263 [Phrynosoma platyrhinos]
MQENLETGASLDHPENVPPAASQMSGTKACAPDGPEDLEDEETLRVTHADVGEIAEPLKDEEEEEEEEEMDQEGDTCKKSGEDDHVLALCQESSMTCAICGLDCKDVATLGQHQESHGAHLCNLCGQSFQDSAGLVRHRENHTSYICTECGRSFGDAHALACHQENHESWICGVCGQNFKDSLTLAHHEETHSLPNRKTFEGSFVKSRARALHSKSGKCFKENPKLRFDQKSCEDLVRSDSRESFAVGVVLEHQKTQAWVCLECGERCQDSVECRQTLMGTTTLKHHQNSHKKDKVAGSLEPEESFNTDSDFVLSQKNCMGRFSNKSLLAPQKIFPSGEPCTENAVPSSCQNISLEGQPSQSHSSLTAQQGIPAEDKTLGSAPQRSPAEEKAPLCGHLQDSCILASQEEAHIEEKPGSDHHGVSLLQEISPVTPPHKRTPAGERPSPVSTEMAALIRHPSPNPYKCHNCEQSFADATGLSHHQIDHTKERLLKCPECGRGFPERLALIRHQMEHTAEKGRGSRQNLRRKSSHGKEKDQGSPLEFGESFTEISAILLQRRNHVPEMGTRQHLKNHGADGKGDAGDALEPYFHFEFGKNSSMGGGLAHHHIQQDKGKYFAHSEPGKISRNSSILLQHLQNHTGEKP